MDASEITRCSMSGCVYNQNNACRTPGISVGPHAECNTYVTANSKGGFKEIRGQVGACIASDCKYNEKLECRAPNIDVDNHELHADCRTYEPK